MAAAGANFNRSVPIDERQSVGNFLTKSAITSTTVFCPEGLKLSPTYKQQVFALIDKATEAADAAVERGQPAAGARIYIALAEKLDKKTWGKSRSVEVTSKNQAPIAVQVDLDVPPLLSSSVN